MDAMNPASFYRDYEEFKRFPDKLPINNASSISSKQIPSIKGKTLKGEKRDLVEMIKDCKLTIVMFKFRDIGEKHLADYREYLINNYKREFRVQFVDVVVTENYMFRPLTALINWGNKKRTPQEYHSKTLVHYGSVTRQRLDLGMRNSLFGWVFLCDRNGRVLWETNGKANQQDFNQLDEIIKSRLNSLQNSNNNNK